MPRQLLGQHSYGILQMNDPAMAGPVGLQIKINCGGGPVQDFVGDVAFNGGTGNGNGDTIETSAPSAAPENVYRSERFGDITYTFPMKPASSGYVVRLHFAETKFTSTGRRLFTVEINGQAVLEDFDIFAEAGAKDKAVVKEISGIGPDAQGNVVIHFRPGSADNPKINGIEIVPAGN